jgi:hypothetical protein
MITCPICQRETPSEAQEKHHLIPKSKKGKEVVLVCCDCGDMVHKIFTNKQLALTFNSIDNIILNEKIIKWVKWIQKKPVTFGINMKNKKRRH